MSTGAPARHRLYDGTCSCGGRGRSTGFTARPFAPPAVTSFANFAIADSIRVFHGESGGGAWCGVPEVNRLPRPPPPPGAMTRASPPPAAAPAGYRRRETTEIRA
ncbi:unnamed protein product [Closterium sp. NIES-53]